MSGKAVKTNNGSRQTDKSMRKELTKSLVEDASEDFSNIEEHISSFKQNKQNDSPQKNNPEPITGMNFKDQQITLSYMASYHSRQQAIKSTLAGQTSSNFGGNLTFENSSIFDENNNQKNFIGSTSSNRHSTTQREGRKMGVEHKGHDLKDSYTLKIPTLFNTIRFGLEGSYPIVNRLSTQSLPMEGFSPARIHSKK